MVQRDFSTRVSALSRACAETTSIPSHEVCSRIAVAKSEMQTRAAVASLMQLLAFALFLSGMILIIRRLHAKLVRGVGPALESVAEPARRGGDDELDQLLACFAEMRAWRAGSEAQGRWGKQQLEEDSERKSQALQTLHNVARVFSDSAACEINLFSGLLMLETSLGARTVAMCLNSSARQAIGAPAVIHTHGEPMLADKLRVDPMPHSAGVRFVPAWEGCAYQTMVVPMSRTDAAIGKLVAEFEPEVDVDNIRLQLAECFAHLATLTISSVSRNQEERRIALMEERSAIAADLHDSLAQSLAFMKIQVARLQGHLERQEQPGEVHQVAVEIRAALSTAYREVRDLIATFRVRIGPRGVLVAIQDAIEEFGQRSTLDISLDARLGHCRLEANEEFHVLQLVREALSNTVRHARARHAWVSAVYSDSQGLVVSIDDDGRGTGSEPGDKAGHYGLGIMSERAHTLNGKLEIAPRPGGGTRVRLQFLPKRLTLTEASIPN